MTPSMTLNRHKIDNYVIIASLKSEATCKLIKRIPGLHLMISSLQGSVLRTLAESLGKPHDSTSLLEACLGNLILKYTHLVLMH